MQLPQTCVFDRKWNQAKGIKQLHFKFFIGLVAGKWKYGFANIIADNENLSLDELMKFPNLMNIRLSAIDVEGENHQMFLNHDLVDMEKLLNFVSCLSNEPALSVRKPQHLDSYEGRAVLKWLEEKRFSEFVIEQLTPDYYKLLENQKKSTKITIWGIEESAPFLERRLMSGELRRAWIFCNYKFPSAVLAQIIENVKANPKDYSKTKIEIFAQFDDSTRELMDEMTEKKLCSFEQESRVNWKIKQLPMFKFVKQTPMIRVQNTVNNQWFLTCE